MEPTLHDLRLLLGLKLRSLRQARGASLREVAAAAGVSVSYLSEIEKGRKYPKPERLLELARALGTDFEELVSPRVEEPLAPLREAIASPFLREFPFHLFGVETEGLLALVAAAPEQAGGLVRVLEEVARDYDLRVKHFLFAALRAYQQLHRNHFPELEAAAEALRRRHGWPARPPVEAHVLRALLEEEHRYALDTTTLAGHPELHAFRSVFRARAEHGGPLLYVNDRLRPEQQAFLFARELGFRELGLEARPATSSWTRVQHFEPVLNNFRASYFAGALLVAEEALRADLERFFAREAWEPEALSAMMQAHRATPEMLFYRITQLAPAHLGLRDLYFMRFTRAEAGGRCHLTKVLNMSLVPVPQGLRRELDYGRRWSAIGGVRALTEREGLATPEAPLVRAQRSHFVEDGARFFEISVSRPLALGGGASSVTLGFLMNEAFGRAVGFAEDPAVPEVEVVYEAGEDRYRARLEALAGLGVRLE